MPGKINEDLRVKRKTYGQAQCIVEHSDLTAEATEQAITWATLAGETIPPRARFMDMTVEVLIPFSDGGAGTLTLDVGKNGGDTDECIDGADMTAAANTIAVRSGIKSLGAYEATAYAPVLTFVSSVNVDTFTAGKAVVTYYFERYHTELE